MGLLFVLESLTSKLVNSCSAKGVQPGIFSAARAAGGRRRDRDGARRGAVGAAVPAQDGLRVALQREHAAWQRRAGADGVYAAAVDH